MTREVKKYVSRLLNLLLRNQDQNEHKKNVYLSKF